MASGAGWLLALCAACCLAVRGGCSDVEVPWNEEFALQHDINSPLEVYSGDKLVIMCGDGESAQVLPVNSSQAEQCNSGTESEPVLIDAELSDYLADCLQSCIPLQHTGSDVMSHSTDYIPGHVYFFAEVPLGTSICKFSLAVFVKINCSSPDENCPQTVSSSSPSPSPYPFSSYPPSPSTSPSPFTSTSYSPSPSPSPFTSSSPSPSPSLFTSSSPSPSPFSSHSPSPSPSLSPSSASIPPLVFPTVTTSSSMSPHCLPNTLLLLFLLFLLCAVTMASTCI